MAYRTLMTNGVRTVEVASADEQAALASQGWTVARTRYIPEEGSGSSGIAPGVTVGQIPVWDGDSYEPEVATEPTAADIPFVATGSVSSTNVQTAIEELSGEISASSVIVAAPLFSTQRWTAPPHGTRGTAAYTAGTLQLVPFWVTTSVTIDALGCEVTTAAAGATVELSIYDGVSAGATQLASVTVSAAAVASLTGVLATPLALTPRLYGLSVLPLGGAPTLRRMLQPPFAFPADTFGGTQPPATGRTSTVSNLASTPATLPAVGPYGNAPLIAVRAL